MEEQEIPLKIQDFCIRDFLGINPFFQKLDYVDNTNVMYPVPCVYIKLHKIHKTCPGFNFNILLAKSLYLIKIKPSMN